jgi:phosphatidylserine/phosphatidylglycerophosphate/cardiolipin synthase-like enzyme
VNEFTDKEHVRHPSFPREDNLRTIEAFGLGENVTRREARSDDIAHNKFMVRLVGGDQPAEVWTGSTNMSQGGISGQTNVGHWVRNRAVASQFVRYWDLLAGDPGGRDGDTPAAKRAKNNAFRAAVADMSPVPADLTSVPAGVTVAFSPRPDDDLLTSYAALLDSAGEQACITLAFTVSSAFKDVLKDNTPRSQLAFLLLEKKDRPSPRSRTAFVALNASNNVYEAWGSFLEHPVYQWAKETNAGLLGLNQHVSYIHSKFMLVDPLSADPIVVTGSANFSAASTTDNDENMLIVRGDRRVADIYLTEFNRLFNHYYFRSVTEDQAAHHREPDKASLFLSETADWQKKYAPGSFKAKRLALYRDMEGFTTL